jgi:DNA-binding NtrC family response regulator
MTPDTHATFPRQSAPLRVLLVEDDPLVRDLYTNMLRRLGHEVTAAADAEEGLAIFCREEHAFGWVMVDMMLPGMPGNALLAAMRRRQPALPAVVVSGRAAAELEPTHAGRTVFLAKPFQLTDLRRAIREAKKSARADGAEA